MYETLESLLEDWGLQELAEVFNVSTYLSIYTALHRAFCLCAYLPKYIILLS